MALGLVLTGHFSNLLVFTSLIIVHEMGHVLAARMFKYDVSKIIIYPYGGVTKLNTIINTNIYKDLFVAISGILVQTFYFLIVYFFYKNGVVREYIYELFVLYHKSMILFNLMPIPYLDGFKITNLLLSKFLNFNITNKISVLVSFFFIIFFMFSGIFEKNYSVVMIIGVLMQNIYKFYNEISYIYNRFLLERYIYNLNFKNKKIIDTENKMFKNSSHLFIKNGKIINEKTFLAFFFDKKY